MSSLLEIATSNPHYRESVVAVVLTCAIIVLLNGLYQYASQGNRREYVYASVPPGWYGYRIGQARYLTQCAAMIQEGIQKFGESGVYWIPTMMGPTMVAPRRYLAELKNHPNLSFADYLHEAFGGAHTNFEAPLRSQNFMAVVKRHITRSLGHVVGILTEEAALALEDDLPPSDEWTPYKPHPTTMRIVSRISSRLFVGEALCRQKRWLDITLNFSSQINTAGVGLRMAGKRMAPIVKWWIPSYRLFKKTLREADAILMGVVKERRELEKAQGAAYVKPDDALQWALDLGEPDSELANFQLFLSNVAIQTTSAALTHMVYDLCMYPEYVEILREELREVLGDGNFSAKAEVQKLVKMDSFMKESQRLHPLQNMVMQRKATKDIELSDGLRIYAGERLQFSSRSIMRDPRVYSDPETFDGLRFYKLRQQPGRANAYQFATSSQDFIAFGHGTHACPGRFFAACEIKIILSHLLRIYDFRFPDGQKERPKSVCFEDAIMPHMSQEILFRRRR